MLFLHNISDLELTFQNSIFATSEDADGSLTFEQYFKSDLPNNFQRILKTGVLAKQKINLIGDILKAKEFNLKIGLDTGKFNLISTNLFNYYTSIHTTTLKAILECLEDKKQEVKNLALEEYSYPSLKKEAPQIYPSLYKSKHTGLFPVDLEDQNEEQQINLDKLVGDNQVILKTSFGGVDYVGFLFHKELQELSFEDKQLPFIHERIAKHLIKYLDEKGVNTEHSGGQQNYKRKRALSFYDKAKNRFSSEIKSLHDIDNRFKLENIKRELKGIELAKKFNSKVRQVSYNILGTTDDFTNKVKFVENSIKKNCSADFVSGQKNDFANYVFPLCVGCGFDYSDSVRVLAILGYDIESDKDSVQRLKFYVKKGVQSEITIANNEVNPRLNFEIKKSENELYEEYKQVLKQYSDISEVEKIINKYESSTNVLEQVSLKDSGSEVSRFHLTPKINKKGQRKYYLSDNKALVSKFTNEKLAFEKEKIQLISDAGTGKTYLTIHVILDFWRKHNNIGIFCFPRKGLTEQQYYDFKADPSNEGVEPVLFCGGQKGGLKKENQFVKMQDLHRQNVKYVILCTTDQVPYLKKKVSDSPTFDGSNFSLITDESHLVTTESTFRECMDELLKVQDFFLKVVYLSATPVLLGVQDFKIYKVTNDRPKPKVVYTEFSDEKFRHHETILSKISEVKKEHPKDVILVYIDSHDKIELLIEEAEKMGFKCDSYSAQEETPIKDTILNKTNTFNYVDIRNVDVIFCTRAFSVGVNLLNNDYKVSIIYANTGNRGFDLRNFEQFIYRPRALENLRCVHVLGNKAFIYENFDLKRIYNDFKNEALAIISTATEITKQRYKKSNVKTNLDYFRTSEQVVLNEETNELELNENGIINLAISVQMKNQTPYNLVDLGYKDFVVVDGQEIEQSELKKSIKAVIKKEKEQARGVVESFVRGVGMNTACIAYAESIDQDGTVLKEAVCEYGKENKKDFVFTPFSDEKANKVNKGEFKELKNTYLKIREVNKVHKLGFEDTTLENVCVVNNSRKARVLIESIATKKSLENSTYGNDKAVKAFIKKFDSYISGCEGDVFKATLPELVKISRTVCYWEDKKRHYPFKKPNSVLSVLRRYFYVNSGKEDGVMYHCISVLKSSKEMIEAVNDEYKVTNIELMDCELDNPVYELMSYEIEEGNSRAVYLEGLNEAIIARRQKEKVKNELKESKANKMDDFNWKKLRDMVLSKLKAGNTVIEKIFDLAIIRIDGDKHDVKDFWVKNKQERIFKKARYSQLIADSVAQKLDKEIFDNEISYNDELRKRKELLDSKLNFDKVA